MTSRFRDTETGTVVCMDCGRELVSPAEQRYHRDYASHLHMDTEKPPVAEAGDSSALSGVAPQSASGTDAIPEMLQKSTFMPAGAFRTSDHMYYFNGQGPVPGATSVLDILSKPALITWKAQEAVRAVLADPDTYVVSTDDPTYQSGMSERVNAALSVADQQRDTAAKLGSSIHLLADMTSREVPCDLCGGSGWITGTDPCGKCAAERAQKGFHVSDKEMPYLDAWKRFMAFLEAQGGRIVSSEHMVWSANGYGGTYDLIIEWQEKLWLLDIKTSKGYYPEYGLQLAAYQWADFIILEGDPSTYSMPEIHHAGVLHLRPDQYPDTGWRLVEYPITYEKDYMSFLGALEVYRWRKEGRFLKSVLNPVTGTAT